MVFSLDLCFDVVLNMGGICFVCLMFINKGFFIICLSDWKIYFNVLREMC